MLFASETMLAAMKSAFPPPSLMLDLTEIMSRRSRPFMGMEVAKSPLFPISCTCKVCHGAGYPQGDSFCLECKGAGGHDIIGMILPDDVVRGPKIGEVLSFVPHRVPDFDHETRAVFVQSWEKRFPARFPPSVSVPLRDVSLPIGGRS